MGRRVRAACATESRHVKHAGHNRDQARARRPGLAPAPQIAGRGQAACRRPIVTVTTAGPGPESHPLRPTLNSSPLPAPSWRRHEPPSGPSGSGDSEGRFRNPPRRPGPPVRFRRRGHAEIRRRGADSPLELPNGGPGVVGLQSKTKKCFCGLPVRVTKGYISAPDGCSSAGGGGDWESDCSTFIGPLRSAPAAVNNHRSSTPKIFLRYLNGRDAEFFTCTDKQTGVDSDGSALTGVCCLRLDSFFCPKIRSF